MENNYNFITGEYKLFNKAELYLNIYNYYFMEYDYSEIYLIDVKYKYYEQSYGNLFQLTHSILHIPADSYITTTGTLFLPTGGTYTIVNNDINLYTEDRISDKEIQDLFNEINAISF